MNITNPLEQLIADALMEADVAFKHESEGGTKNLDFYLPNLDVYIEVKGGHSDRISEQMSRDFNVIAVQGVKSVHLLCKLLGL